MKKKKRIVTIILWLAALAVLFIWSSPEQKVDRFVAKYAEVLEESLGTDLSGGYPGGLGIQYYNCWGEDSGHPIGEFCFGPSLLHGRQYYGCYYSPTMSRAAFRAWRSRSCRTAKIAGRGTPRATTAV